MKKRGTCPAARKFQLLARMISRLVHGNDVEFHARHENLYFMSGMKSDDIEATASGENLKMTWGLAPLVRPTESTEFTEKLVANL